MQWRSLAYRFDHPPKFVRAMNLYIGDGAGRWLEVEVEVAGWGHVPEGQHLHCAATTMGVEGDPEFAATGGGGAQVYEHQRHQMLAECVEEFDWGAR